MSPPSPSINPRSARTLLLICFFVSGFTALLYQTVWLRLALAKFGVNTSVVATVLAVFMLGLAVGSMMAARAVRQMEARFGIGPLRVYAIAEFVVGVGGLVVPVLFSAGREALLAVGPESRFLYTAASTLILTAILLPFCTAMGVTFPSAIAFLKRAGAAGEGREPFSALYLANVAGALLGAVVTPLFLIESFGFLATGRGAAVFNAAIGAASFLAFRHARLEPAAGAGSVPPPLPRDSASRIRRLALFVTGFSTMGMEVVWMRLYPAINGTLVYSFAEIVAIYLFATALGSFVYRRQRRSQFVGRIGLWFPWLCAASLLPLLSASVTFPEINVIARVFIGLAPFCALLGFLTPALIDREAGDDPARAGEAYGINLLGCVMGSLVAGLVLLPVMGTRGSAFVLAAPLFLFLIARSVRREGRVAWSFAALAVSTAIWFSTTLFEERFPKEQVRRDHVATVVAAGTGMKRSLYVNGTGMTALTTITKMMAHFPAAHLPRRPGQPIDALVICFGMGTSFRSLASWGANVTAVELVPSVPELFGYFFPEGPEQVRGSSGKLRIVIDDGRRFLDRSHDMFDLITIDPPPPVAAAGSSLLYSKEFYASAKRKMKPGAILEAWLPTGDRETVAGMTLSVLESFAYVRVYGSIYGVGYHVIASDDPIPRLSPEELVARMPEAAVSDMREWNDSSPTSFFARMIGNEYKVDSLLIDGSREKTLAISDDRPVNEFLLMRRLARGALNSPGSEGQGAPVR